MYVTGTVQGEAARSYPDFCYRHPIMEPLTLHSVDPDRVNPMHEYPRWSSKPGDHSTMRTVDLAKYRITIGSIGDYGMAQVDVWMVPCEYTIAKAEKRVCGFRVANPMLFRDHYIDEAMKMAFSARLTTTSKGGVEDGRRHA